MATIEQNFDNNNQRGYSRNTVDDADVAGAQSAAKFSGPIGAGSQSQGSSDPEPKAEDFGGDLAKWSAAKKAWRNRQSAKVEGQKKALGSL